MEQKGELAGYYVEVKNINSFRFMEKAVLFEVKRQSDLLDVGQKPKQENRGWDERKGGTVSQRDKEEAHDYRYFPDPDIPPMVFTDDYFAELKGKLPELPYQLRSRLIQDYRLNPASADFFSAGAGIELSKKFEEVAKILTEAQKNGDFQKVANLLINKPEYRDMDTEELLAQLSKPEEVKGLSAEDLENIVKKVLEDNPSAVQNYIAGKQNALQFLIGAVLRELKGKTDADTVAESLRKVLNG